MEEYGRIWTNMYNMIVNEAMNMNEDERILTNINEYGRIWTVNEAMERRRRPP